MPDLAGAKPHQAITATLGKRLGQPRPHLSIGLGCVLLILGDQVALGR